MAQWRISRYLILEIVRLMGIHYCRSRRSSVISLIVQKMISILKTAYACSEGNIV